MAKRESKPGIGSVFGSFFSATTSAFMAVDNLAQTAEVISAIGLDKATNMRKIVSAEDKLSVLEAEAAFQKRKQKLAEKGFDTSKIEII